MDSFIDRDIEHIRTAIFHSLDDQLNPILTSSYWRQRVSTVMRLHHLSKAQLIQADAILAIIDQFDLTHHDLPIDMEPSLQAL